MVVIFPYASFDSKHVGKPRILAGGGVSNGAEVLEPQDQPFAGVFSSRARQLAKYLEQIQPALIFIDESDLKVPDVSMS
jgi:hypothetical protein